MSARSLGQAIALWLTLAACGGSSTVEGALDGGVAGNAGAAGAAGAGGGAAGCAAGERWLDDGSCQRAGIPPEACGTGFVPDDEGGCEPILPEAPCVPGTMAVPGQSECVEVAPCGQAPWGDIPVDSASVQYVDQSYTGGDSDGTAERPWVTIQEGIDASEADGVVAIAAGSYIEDTHVTERPVRIWGRCPALVEIVGATFGVDVGSPDGSAAVAGTEIHTLAITGAGTGVISSDALDLRIDRLWIHDTGDIGVLLADFWGPESATITGSLLEGNDGGGVVAVSAPVFIDSTVIRDTRWDADNGGLGIAVEGRSTDTVTFELTSSVVERAAAGGVVLASLKAEITGSVVRDGSGKPDGTYGVGISSVQVDDAPRTDLTLRQSVVSGNHYVALIMEGTDSLIEHTVVRDTLPDLATGALGGGIVAQMSPSTGERSMLALRKSLIERSVDLGVGVTCADALLESTIIRDTALAAATGTRGMGLILAVDTHSPIECGPSGATLRWSRIEQAHSVGLSVVDSHATAEAILIRRTLPINQGTFGDGIEVLSGDLGASLELHDSRIESSARAGVANFGSLVSIGTTELECNPIHLDGEPFYVDFTFEDLGGNECGCDGASTPCQVVSSSLEPPLGTGG